jgi:hypothetical protein
MPSCPIILTVAVGIPDSPVVACSPVITDPDSLLLVRPQQSVGCLVCFHRTVLPNRLEIEADTH